MGERLQRRQLPGCVYLLTRYCRGNTHPTTGHEAAYVIVSTVRTTGPGFLRSLNRMNVMLTRCKAGMVVVTSRRFLNEGGRDTLLGKLARRWNGSSEAWVNAVELSGKGANLPKPFNSF